MINDGLIIMAVGMLVVFAFLTIMVILMRFMSGLVLRFFPEKEETTPARKKSASGTGKTNAADNTEVAVAIAAAYNLN